MNMPTALIHPVWNPFLNMKIQPTKPRAIPTGFTDGESNNICLQETTIMSAA